MVKCIVFFTVLVTFIHKSFGQRNNWEYFGENQFPAYVRQIDFPGASMTSLMGVAFGSWTVSFTNTNLPIMVTRYGGFKYTIYGLTAHNDVLGNFPCIIYYINGANGGQRRRGITAYQWNLGILQEAWNPPTDPNNWPKFAGGNSILSIPFPVTIQLK